MTSINDIYNREYAIDEARLLRFLKDTQNDELRKSRVLENEQKRREFFARISSEISRRGIADVLRNGVDFYPSSFVMFYLTASDKNLWRDILTREKLTQIIENFAY